MENSPNVPDSLGGIPAGEAVTSVRAISDRESVQRVIAIAILFFGASTSLIYPKAVLLASPIITLAAGFLAFISPGAKRRPTVGVVEGSIFALAFVAFLSAIRFFGNSEVLLTFFCRYCFPAVVLYLLLKLRITPWEATLAIGSMTAGSLVPIIGGLLTYYGEFGFPTLNEIVVNRSQDAKIDSFREVTFGSLGNLGSFMVLILPPILSCSLHPDVRMRIRITLGGTFVLGSLILVVSYIRAGILAVVLAGTLISVYHRRLPWMLLLILMGSFAVTPDLVGEGYVFSEKLEMAAVGDREDASVDSRMDSVTRGISVMAGNPLLGVGPERSRFYIPQHAAHQMSVQQGVELGVVGFVLMSMMTIAVWYRTGRCFKERGKNLENRWEFTFLAGPCTYLAYGALSNAVLSLGPLNGWAVLCVSLVAFSSNARDANVIAAGEAERSP